MDESTLAKLSAVVGTQRKAVVEADGIPTRVYPGMEVEAYRGKTSTVAAVYTDFLGNEAYITEFHLNVHIKTKGYGINEDEMISQALVSPQWLFHDKDKGVIMYGAYNKAKERYFFVTVGQDNRMVYTIERKAMLFQNRTRYDILYSEREK